MVKRTTRRRRVYREPMHWRRFILKFFYALPDVKSNQSGVSVAKRSLIAIGVTLAMAVCFSAAAVAEQPLTIVDDSLPALNAGAEFQVQLHASGGIPPYLWTVSEGELPEGITLSPTGMLAGRPVKAGKLNVKVMVADSSHPRQSAQKDLQTVVSAALMLDWLEAPKVRDNRIDGSVQVSNGSTDPFELTVIIEAVATDNQRATAIGYQHFVLKPGVANFVVPFGNTMAHGSYVIHVDAVAEIPARKSILRQRLQSAQPLTVAVGP